MKKIILFFTLFISLVISYSLTLKATTDVVTLNMTDGASVRVSNDGYQGLKFHAQTIVNDERYHINERGFYLCKGEYVGVTEQYINKDSMINAYASNTLINGHNVIKKVIEGDDLDMFVTLFNIQSRFYLHNYYALAYCTVTNGINDVTVYAQKAVCRTLGKVVDAAVKENPSLLEQSNFIKGVKNSAVVIIDRLDSNTYRRIGTNDIELKYENITNITDMTEIQNLLDTNKSAYLFEATFENIQNYPASGEWDNGKDAKYCYLYLVRDGANPYYTVVGVNKGKCIDYLEVSNYVKAYTNNKYIVPSFILAVPKSSYDYFKVNAYSYPDLFGYVSLMESMNDKEMVSFWEEQSLVDRTEGKKYGLVYTPLTLGEGVNLFAKSEYDTFNWTYEYYFGLSKIASNTYRIENGICYE